MVDFSICLAIALVTFKSYGYLVDTFVIDFAACCSTVSVFDGKQIAPDKSIRSRRLSKFIFR